MTTAFDNELDRLLRRHTPGAGGSRDSAHLDVDTLALYAEHALPARTRAAHTEHLATCDDCRASLAMLARLLAPEHETAVAAEASPQITPLASIVQTSTVAVQEEMREVASTAQDTAPRRKWRSALRELFAAPRLSYALPAVLLLFVVGSVALLLFVRRTEPEMIALVAERASPTSGVAMNSNMNANMASANMNGNIGVPDAAATASNANAASNIAPPVTGASVNTAASTTTHPASAPTQTDAAARSGTIVPSPMNQPPAAPERASTTSSAVASAKPEPQSVPVTTEDEVLEAEANRPPASGVASRRAAPVSLSDSTRETPALRKQRSRNESDGDAVESGNRTVESRTIGNRRFARRGATWIDEAYVSGSAVTTVRRNSEQLRALLADEPGLRTVVESLPGELIVVWKNRAYRIR